MFNKQLIRTNSVRSAQDKSNNETIKKQRPISRLLWILFAFFAIVIGLYPALYFLIDREFGLLSSKEDELLKNLIWNAGFYMHILLGGLSLLIGWTQFSPKLRNRNISMHRQIGKIYVLSALLSALAGSYVALFATGGWVSAVGFFCLACIWFLTTFKGYTHIKNGRIDQHEKWMIFSYAACFSAVTLRIWLPLLIISLGDFNTAYRIVAWLCWIPNLFVAILIVKRLKLKQSTQSAV